MSEPHERLNELMNQRRLELDKRWKRLASEARISVEYLSAIRRGDYRPSDLAARRLDDALRWEAGSILAILDGGDPTPLETAGRRAVTPGDLTPAQREFDQWVEKARQDPEFAAAFMELLGRARGLDPGEEFCAPGEPNEKKEGGAA